MLKKTNITLKLDSELLQSVKVLAAKRGTSVSALLTAKLKDAISQDDEYDAAMKRSLDRIERGWKLGWKKPASRDELHER
jgi:predicted transcriptional regulator